MTGCCAFGCTNSSSKGFLMKRFPCDPERRRVWAAKVKRENWTPTNASYLCEAHFAPEMFEQNRADGRRMLKYNAVPTIFPYIPEKKCRKSPMERSPRKALYENTVSIGSYETSEQIKMSRISTDIWHHFTKTDKKGKCRYCLQMISCPSGSISNLKRHLKARHPTVPYEQSETWSRSQLTVDENTADFKPIFSTESFYFCSSRLVENLNLETDSPSESEPSPSYAVPSPPTVVPQKSQSMLEGFIEPFNNSKVLDMQLMKMICKEFLPFSAVENEEFRKLIQMLCPNYQLPSRKTLSNCLLIDTVNEVITKVKDELSTAKAVCLTSDWWINANNTNIYTLTAHYIDETTKLKSYFLECLEFENGHTAENIANWITDVTSRFGITFKIIAIVTDNASKMNGAATLLKLQHISCFAHSLNRIMLHAISYSIQHIIDKVKQAIMFFKMNSIAQSKLTELQTRLKTELKLKQNVPTRWDSTYEMLRRFFINKEAIKSSVVMLGESLNMTEEDWNVINKAIEVLEVFDEATREVSSEQNVSLSKMGVIIRLLVHQLKKYKNQNKASCSQIDLLVDEILKGLSDQFGAISQNELVLESTLLDPRFKKQGFTDNTTFSECYDSIMSKIKSLAALKMPQTKLQQPRPSTTNSLIWQKFDEEINSLQGMRNVVSAELAELDTYLMEEYLPRGHDPLLWWESRKVVYPTLYSFVLKRLCIPATSVPCERIFSKAGQEYSKKRSHLTSEKLTKILFVNQNLD